VAFSDHRLGRSSQDTRNQSTGFHLSHDTQATFRSSAAMMARNGQADSKDFSANLSKGESQSFVPSSTVPQKRKGSPQVKFYAVRAGRIPGVYLSWEECERNISGFRGAACEYIRSGK
jgi:hypothetical protein